MRAQTHRRTAGEQGECAVGTITIQYRFQWDADRLEAFDRDLFRPFLFSPGKTIDEG